MLQVHSFDMANFLMLAVRFDGQIVKHQM